MFLKLLLLQNNPAMYLKCFQKKSASHNTHKWNHMDTHYDDSNNNNRHHNNGHTIHFAFHTVFGLSNALHRLPGL